MAKIKFEKKSGKLAWCAWTAAVLFYLYEYLVRVAPSVMEHEMATEFAASATIMATALGSYYFAYSPLQLFAGMLFDRFGGKVVLVPASILVSIGCIFSTIHSTSVAYVAIGRTLAGVGSSCAFIGTMYLAAVWFHDNRLAFLSGLTTSLGICGALLAQAPLSFLVDGTGWRMSLIVLAVIGIFVTTIVAVCVPKTPRWEQEKRATDFGGSSFKHFLAGLISVCKNKQTWIVGLVASCLYMPTVVFGDLWGVPYIHHSLGISKTRATEIVGMLYLGWLVGGPLAGLLSDMIGCRKKLLVAGTFTSTVLFLAVLLCPIKSPFIIGALLFLAGVASTPQVICFVASLEANKASVKGSAIAVVNMIVMLVGGVFQPIIGWLMERGGRVEVGHVVSCEAFRNALLTMPLLTFIGFCLSFFIKKGISVRE
ncbi:MAG: MFS transporter [Puniceicoccales bacterium]|jgi:MFS family permease|nr:MFS transporter [Puniceicoccales bacterium]